MKGYCGACGKDCRYVNVTTYMSVWVHDETGDYRSSEPFDHDCNTHIVKEI